MTSGTPVTLACDVTKLTAPLTISWWQGDTQIVTESGSEYSARKLHPDDIFKSMILRQECLILLRWYRGNFVSFGQVFRLLSIKVKLFPM